MRIHRRLPTQRQAPVALTIGNFDGVHRGHQAMLARLIEAAEDLRLPPAVLTFDPHPREFFARKAAPPRLSTLRQKLDLFRAFGVATRRRALRRAAGCADAGRFHRDVLVRGLDARWVLVGDDFRFGRGAPAISRSCARRRQFSVEGMRTVAVEGQRASCTRCARRWRQAISRARRRCWADPTRSAAAWRTATSSAAAWASRRRTFRCATARRCRASSPCACTDWARRRAPAWQASACARRSKADGKPLLEVFLFDFDETIYGRRVTVEFLHKLRDEEKYDTLDALDAADSRRRRRGARLFRARGMMSAVPTVVRR